MNPVRIKTLTGDSMSGIAGVSVFMFESGFNRVMVLHRGADRFAVLKAAPPAHAQGCFRREAQNHTYEKSSELIHLRFPRTLDVGPPRKFRAASVY